MAVVNDPSVDDGQLVDARNFFESQAVTSWHGLLSYVLKPSLTATAARVEVERIDTRRVEHFDQLLDMAIASRDDAVILKEATEYIEKLPNGPRRSEAETEKERVESTIARNRLRDHINDHRQAIDTLDDLQELERIRKRTEELRRQSKDGDADLEVAYVDFIERITAREKLLAMRKRQIQLQETVDNALANGDWTQAAGAIAAATVRDDFWEATANRFAKQMPVQLENRIKSLVNGENFDTASTTANDAVAALRNVEAAVPAEQSAVRKAVTDAYPAVADIRRKSLDEPYDRHLYKEVVSVKNEAICTRYLNTAPVGGMKSVVQGYRDYLESSRRPAEITVTPCIEWGEIKYDASLSYAIKWTIYADGEQVTRQPHLSVASMSELPNQLATGVRMQAKGLDEAIAIKLAIVELDSVSENDDIGSLEKRITPREMLDEKKFRVSGTDVTKDHFFWFSGLQGYRREPSLPSWHP
jgi:hypothetical protein